MDTTNASHGSSILTAPLEILFLETPSVPAATDAVGLEDTLLADDRDDAEMPFKLPAEEDELATFAEEVVEAELDDDVVDWVAELECVVVDDSAAWVDGSGEAAGWFCVSAVSLLVSVSLG